MGHRASPGKKAGRPARTTVRLETPADSSFSDSYGNDNKEDGKGGTYTFALGEADVACQEGNARACLTDEVAHGVLLQKGSELYEGISMSPNAMVTVGFTFKPLLCSRVCVCRAVDVRQRAHP